MRSRTILFSLVVGLLIPVAVDAQPSQIERVQFPSGTSSATIDGSVLRDETTTYLLDAVAGQTMQVRITSLEDNAVFSVYGRAQFVEQPLSGDLFFHLVETTDWQARLEEDGTYAVLVGSRRGNANYSITFEIR